MSEPRIFTVTELTGSIRGLLETRFPHVSVAGEISNLRRPRSGHLYFTLKDDQASIRAVLFKMQQRYLERLPQEGQQVICRGRISVYEPRGEYQLIIDTMELQGAGDLRLAFEKLKRKLAAEGLFAREAKKEISPCPSHITLVTSPDGAAVHDFIRVARSRFPLVRLTIYPVTVQGDQAHREMIQAIRDINRHLDSDCIVLCRGGGSIEDLQPFNEEELARAIFSSEIPVVSAVGHEIDVTIADFVADLRAPTPSAAAEILLPDISELKTRLARLRAALARTVTHLLESCRDRLALLQEKLRDRLHPVTTMLLKVDHLGERLIRAMEVLLDSRRQQLDQLETRLRSRSPAPSIDLAGRRLDELHRRMSQAMLGLLEDRQARLAHLAGVLDAVSPLATLARGYAIVRKEGKRGRIVTSSRDTRTGERLEILLHQGRLLCRVEEVILPQKQQKKG
ncbi:exodeoxyribonuclease VII large subunit [Desulfolithobacter sp.]